MHVLILNHHPLQAEFLKKSLRYENIGADLCHPENLIKIWYNQYDALLIPVKQWTIPPLKNLPATLKTIGNVPTIITHQTPPPTNIEKTLKTLSSLELIATQTPFTKLIEKIKKLKPPSFKTANSREIRISDLYINLETREVYREGKSRHLRNKEFSLLECLMRHSGKALTRSYLLENVWDRNTTILSNTVDVHINRLRHKIDHGFSYRMIVTIPCTGYKLQVQNA